MTEPCARAPGVCGNFPDWSHTLAGPRPRCLGSPIFSIFPFLLFPPSDLRLQQEFLGVGQDGSRVPGLYSTLPCLQEGSAIHSLPGGSSVPLAKGLLAQRGSPESHMSPRGTLV